VNKKNYKKNALWIELASIWAILDLNKIIINLKKTLLL